MPKIVCPQKLERSFYWFGMRKGMDCMLFDLTDKAKEMNLSAFSKEQIANAVAMAYFGLGFGGNEQEDYSDIYQEALGDLY
jgi:hypothetical protein